MPELPEVETTRQGIAPHIGDRRVSGVIVRQPKLRWPPPTRASCRLHRADGGATRQVPPDRLRQRHPDPAPGHVRQPAHTAGGHSARPARPRRSAVRRTVPAPARPAPLRRGTVDRHAGSRTRLDHTPGARTLVRCVRHRPPLHPGASQKDTDQAVADGWDCCGGGWKHLRHREPVPCRHPPGAALQPDRQGAHRSAGGAGQTGTGADHRAGRHHPACFQHEDGRPGYFQQELLVYGREGQTCPACGSIIKARRIGQRTSAWCPRCQR